MTDQALSAAVAEMEDGQIDADLGGHVFKKRVALPGRGKSGGARTLLAYRLGDRAIFVYGFAKNERDNIDDKELKSLEATGSNPTGADLSATGARFARRQTDRGEKS